MSAQTAPQNEPRTAQPLHVLITGISGYIGRLLAQELVAQGHRVSGIDRRPWPDAPEGVQIHQVDILKRPAEDVFRRHRPDVLVHLATVTHFNARPEERYRVNLWGTRAVFEHAHTYGVRRAIFVGRHTVYGAAADAPLYRREDEPPLAVATFPALADLAAADLYAASALWRHPQIDTAVLRFVYTLGPSRRGTLAGYLRGARVPTVLGFDPLFQFMHERDVAAAIALASTQEAPLRGVFNVAGPAPVPLSLLLRVTGCHAVPVPLPLFDRVLGRFGFSWLPEGARRHIQYPIVVDDSAFRAATGFKPRFDEVQTMEAWRWA